MTKNFVRSLAIAALACAGASAVQAQTVLRLSYPANAPGAVPCLYTTNGAGISADPLTGNLLATGDFSTGCPQTGPSLPPPVIVPGPANWALPSPWAVNQATTVQWAAVNANSCVYGGSFASGWPSGQTACSNTNDCQTLQNVTLIPQTAGQYQFSLTCSNGTGAVTSTSPFRNVASNPPIITQGPTTWNVLPWESGQTKSVQWSATNADNCSFTPTTLPSGVTIAQFLSAGVTSCSTQATCASSNNLTLSASVAGTYGVTLTCTRAGGGSDSSTQSWNVTQSSVGSCLQPAPGWNRVLTAEVFNGGAFAGSSVGFLDVTQFDSIWGRNYSLSGYPIVAQWPGVPQQLVGPKFGNQQYIAAKFRTPASPTAGHNLKYDGTAFAFAGGGVGNIAKASMTVSTVCGDFDTASPNIAPNCKFSQRIGGDNMPIFNSQIGSFCHLQPNTDYYINLIFAPLTSPASATFNGIGGAVPIWQNDNVSN